MAFVLPAAVMVVRSWVKEVIVAVDGGPALYRVTPLTHDVLGETFKEVLADAEPNRVSWVRGRFVRRPRSAVDGRRHDRGCRRSARSPSPLTRSTWCRTQHT
ncbi:hypothetical protein GCM10020220_022700 [Nonomuraea rubra]